MSQMRYLLGVSLLTLLITTVFADDSLELFKGDVRVLDLKPVERVAVGNGKLLSTSLTDSGQLILLAEGEGDTAVHIWHKDGTEQDIKVFINASNPDRTLNEIEGLISGFDGIQVRSVGGRTVLEGELEAKYTPMLEAIAKLYPDIINLTTSPTVSRDKMIYMNVQITEFNTRDLENLGIQWNTSINGPSGGFAGEALNGREFDVLGGAAVPAGISAASAVSSLGYFGIATEIASRINFLVEDGNAIILAEPRLSARSGGEAEFLAGGEVPIPTTNTTGQSNVEFKEFGIILNIKPVADDHGNIIAKVETEISTVDDSLSVQGVPGFRTRKTSADISMRENETLVISGLVNSETSRSVSKVKWLGDLPILGPLFRSTNFNANRSELVIFVTPKIVDAHSQTNIDEKARRESLLQKFRDSVGDPYILD